MEGPSPTERSTLLNWIYDQVSRANGSVSIHALERPERNKPDLWRDGNQRVRQLEGAC